MTSAITTNHLFGWIGTSLTRKVGVGLSVMAILMLLAIGAVFLQVRQQSDVATVVAVATNQRLAIQRIVDGTARAIGGDLQANAVLQRSADEFDWNLRALREGGLTFGSPGSASDLPEGSATIQSQMDRIDRIWQPTYGNVIVVSGLAPTGVQVKELALRVTSRFPALDRALANLEVSGSGSVDASVVAALTDVRQTMNRIRVAVQETAESPEQAAPGLAEDSRHIDDVLETVLSG